MDEFTWMWMYQSWLQDQEDMHKIYKSYALYMGSFFNWEMANRASKQDNPDYATSDEEYEKSYEMVSKFNDIADQKLHRRARRVIEE